MTDIKNKQDAEVNNSTEKNNQDECFKHEEIKQMLEEVGIQSYDPQVVTHLSDYINSYTIDVLDHATTFMKHAGRQMMNLADVKLALNVVATKSPKRPSQKELIKLAREHNKSQFTECSSTGYLPLPTDGCVLTKCNYKLKSSNAQYPVNIPLMDMTNRQNPIVTLNTIKNHSGGIPAVIRTSSGTMSVNVPLNLTPQRIILKPQTPNSNNAMCMSQYKMEDSIKKRMKLEDTKK